MHSKKADASLEALKNKLGEDSKIYNTAQKVAGVFKDKPSLKAQQQELLSVIRSSNGGDVIEILREIAKANPQINEKLRNMLHLTTSNLTRELEKFEINPQDIKFIFDDYTKGTKAAYEEANEKILSKIYDDNYKVVLDSKEFDKFYEEQLKYYEIPSAYKNTLLSIKHKVYNPQGVTYKDLEATRKSLNNLYSEDKTLDSYLKNFISNHLREDINKGINNIFSQNKEAYKQAKTLYETKLADYAQLKEIQDSTIYKKIQNVDNSLEDIAKAILENAKGAGKVKEAGGEAGVTDKTLLNNFNELTKGLTEQNRQSLELNLLHKIFQSSLIADNHIKVFNSELFLDNLAQNKEIFKSTGAKEYIQVIKDFNTLFKRDADILSNLPNANPKENNTNIATNISGPFKHMGVSGLFGIIYRNLPHDGLFFGMLFPTMGQGIQKAALKYHLGKALKESTSLENFNFNITQRANRGGFNSPTKELVERIVEQVSEVKEEALRVAKEGTKAQEIPQDLKEQWLKEFNLESLEQDFIPNFTPEVKAVLQSIGIDKIQLKSGSLVKLDKRERLEFLPHIKPTLENPDVILKHLDSLIFVKDIGKESFFTSVSKGQNGEMIVRSNSFKTIQNLKNKLNTQGEVLFLNKEASNILTEAFTPKMFSKQLDTDIIPQSIDKANRFAEPFSNELFNALPKEIQAQYQSLQKQAREFNLKFQQAKDFDTKMAYRKQYNDILDEIYNFEQIYPVRTPQSPTNLLDKALKEKQEGIAKEQQLQQQAQQEETKRASLLKAQRQSIQQAKDFNVGKSVNEVELALSDSIAYTPLRQTSINLENKTYNAKYVIIKKQDLKPNFTNTGTQGRLIKQTRVIEDIQNNLNPNKLFFSEGSFDGLPIILKDGSVSVGNHRAQALKNLSKESLKTYKEVAKKAFNVDLRDDEVIVRMLDSNIPKQEVLNLSFASNVGREQNIAEKALSTLGKYQEGISKLPKIITASSVEEMQSIISKTLDTTNNGLNTFDTNLALFTYLAKTRNKSILESLESLKGSAEEKQATLRMFVENAGNFYNISQQTLMPKLDLRDYLAQALYFTIKASPSRRDNFREVIMEIQDLLKTTNTQGKNAFIEQNPYYYEDLIGKILGYSLARFKELENPAKNLFEFLSNLETALRQELEPTLFSGGRAISTADIYDFLSMNIKSGIPSKETSELLELLPKLKERQEGFKNSQTLPANPKIVEDTQQTLPSDYSPQSKSLELIAGFKNQLVQGLGAFFENTNISKASYEKYRLLGVDKFFSDFDIASIHNLGLNKDYSQIYTGALQNGKHFELEIQQISPSNNTGLNFHQKIIFKIAKSSGEVEKKLEWIKHYYKTSQKDSTLFENGISIELNNGEKNKLLNYKQNAKSAKLEIQTQPLQETLEQKHNLLPDDDFKSFLELKVIGDDPRAREYKGEDIYNPQRGIYSTLGVNFNNTKEAKAFIDEAQSELTNKEIELLKDNFKEVEIKTDYADYDGRIGKGYPPYIKLNDEKAKALLEYKIKSLGFDESNHFLSLFEKYAKNQNEFLKANGEPFGINFKLPESKDKGKLALKVLSDAKMGQVKGAFYREDLKELSGNGEIDLVWGEVTNPQTHKGYGLAHIIDKHPNFDINLIPEIVERGRLVNQNNMRYRLEFENYVIGLSSEFKGEKQNFIITAFERNKDLDTLSPKPKITDKSDNILPNLDTDIIPQSQTLQALESAIKETQTKQPYKPKIKPILESLAQQWKDKGLITLKWKEKVKGKWLKRTTNFKAEQSLRNTYEKYLEYQEQGNDVSQEISLLQKAINAINAEHNQAKLSKETTQAQARKLQEQKESFIAKENGLDIFIELPHQRLKLYSNKYGTDSKYLQNRLQRGYYKEDVLEEIKQVRESIQKDFNLSPIAEFGINYAEYYRDGKRAINKLLAEAKDYQTKKVARKLTQEEIEQGAYKGQVTGAFYREDLKELSGNGEIDLVWGDSKIGLQKILQKHLNDFADFAGDSLESKLINGLSEIVEMGKIAKTHNGFNIIHNNYKVGINIGWNKNGVKTGDNKWIVTAFDNSKSKSEKYGSNATSFTKEAHSLNSDTIIPKTKDSLDKSLKQNQQQSIKDQELTTGNPIDNIQTPTLKEEFATANTSQKISIIERELLKENEALTKEYNELNEIINNKDYTSFEISEATNFIKSNTKSLGERYIELVNPFDARDIILIQRGTPKEQAEHFLEWKIRNESLIPISKTIDNNKKQILKLKSDLEFSWNEAIKAKLEKNLARLEKYLLKQEEEYFKSLSLTYDLNTQEGLEKTKDLFYRANPTQEQIQLFESILPIAKKLGVEVRNAIREPYQRGGNTKNIAGIYLLNQNSARVKHSVKEKEKSTTLLHELIHSVTSRAMIAYERGATHILNKQQIQAIENINSLYQQVFKQSDELGLSLQNDYGLTNPHELLAELSNPSFVEKLKKINVFEKLIDNIIKLFVSIKEIVGLKKANAYDTLKNNVADIIQNYKSDFTQQYNDLKIRNITLNKNTIPTKSFAYHTQTPKGIASLRASLKEALSPYINKEIINKETGFSGTISVKEINKISSSKAVDKSIYNGFSRDEHFKVSENLKELFENAHLNQTHTDYKERPNIQAVHRFNTPLSINQKEAVAKITLFEKRLGSNKIYSLELESLSPAPLSKDADNTGAAVKAQSVESPHNKSTTIAKTDEAIIPQIQNKFKYDKAKAKDLLEWHKESHPITKDEQGLPKVFYHGSKAQNLQLFDNSFDSSKWGFWFSTDKHFILEAFADSNKEQFTQAFLKMKNPLNATKTFDTKTLQELKGIFNLDNKDIALYKSLSKEFANIKKELHKKGFAFVSYGGGLVEAKPLLHKNKDLINELYEEWNILNDKERKGYTKDRQGLIEALQKDLGLFKDDLTLKNIIKYYDTGETLFFNPRELIALNRFDNQAPQALRNIQHLDSELGLLLGMKGKAQYSNINTRELLQAKGYDGIILNDDVSVVFNPNQIKALQNKGSVPKSKGEFKTATTKDTTKEGFQYFNEQSPNIYHSNPHLGSGLVGGSVAGFESDEQGNLSFNPNNFLLGLGAGVAGSKGVAQGFKAIKDNPKFREKLQEELANALSKGWESAIKQYPILQSLEPRYIIKNEKGREVQAKGVLKELENKEGGKLQKAFLLENRINTEALEKQAVELPKELE